MDTYSPKARRIDAFDAIANERHSDLEMTERISPVVLGLVSIVAVLGVYRAATLKRADAEGRRSSSSVVDDDDASSRRTERRESLPAEERVQNEPKSILKKQKIIVVPPITPKRTPRKKRAMESVRDDISARKNDVEEKLRWKLRHEKQLREEASSALELERRKTAGLEREIHDTIRDIKEATNAEYEGYLETIRRDVSKDLEEVERKFAIDLKRRESNHRAKMLDATRSRDEAVQEHADFVSKLRARRADSRETARLEASVLVAVLTALYFL